MKLQITEENYPALPDTLLFSTFIDGINHVKVVGEIVNSHSNPTASKQNGQYIYGIKWLVPKEEILAACHEDDELNREALIINTSKSSIAQGHKELNFPITSFEHGLTTLDNDFSSADIMNAVVNETVFYMFIDEDEYDQYETYLCAAKQIRTLYNAYDIYSHIILFKDGQPVLKSLIDVLFTLNDQALHDSLTAFRYSNSYLNTLRTLADHVLEKAHINEGVDLMTQEQQVESFINFSKLIANKKHEIVSDKTLDIMRNSLQYRKIVSLLTDKGFGLSKTQQFNVLQAAAYLGRMKPEEKVIYNLSDMGAGKTLMTVESIFLMDLKAVDNFITDDMRDSDDIIENASKICVANKNIIAPTLSIKSSWIETFKLFYNVEKQNDNTYELSFTENGITYYSNLYISAFTARSNAISVEKSLPAPVTDHEYLIIDEIHQLVKRKVNRSKFFARNVVPDESYLSFILSGTLSNLTTSEWYHYVTLMGTHFGNPVLDDSTPRSLESSMLDVQSELERNIAKSAENINTEQKRVFDPTGFDNEQTIIQDDKLTSNKLHMFNLLYASKVLDITPTRDKTDLQNLLISKYYRLTFDSNIISTPNFELFYQLVGSCAITAQSTQVAEELFGEQKTQHNAEVINTPSSLSADDIKLLRTLHEITKDYNVYKSQHIATVINNAILNLNDGLSTKNLYDILAKFASSNLRFFSYLSTLNVDLLEKLPLSGLINQPKLEETAKFKILKDILAKEPDETYLIVVNDASAMLKLAKALGIESITKGQLRKPLDYQDTLDEMFKKQSIVIVPQMMIKSSLDLIQANRLIQYQLNTEISDIIQTQNRINRIGQTRETKAYYIATDTLQKNIIDLFLETYKNIRVAHKGIIELFVDMSSQVNVVNDYITKAMLNIDEDAITDENDEPDYQEPIVNDDGTVSLFPVDDVKEPLIEDDEETEEPVKDNVNVNQMTLFAPIDSALEHQLIPQA